MNKKEQGIPKSIWLLLSYEGFERFSFYGLRAVLILYMTASLADGGLGLERAHAVKLMAHYSSAILGSSLLLGFMSDKMGARTSVLVGSIFATVGHLMYHFQNYNSLIAGMTLLAFATGLIKLSLANVLTLYVTDKTRITAFKRLYTLINVGAFVGQATCSYSRLISYQLTFKILLTGMVTGLMLVSAFIISARRSTAERELEKSDPNEPFEKARLALLGVLCLSFMFYFSIATLEDSVVTLWLEHNCRREVFGYVVPSTLVKAINPLIVMTLTIPILGFFQKMKEKVLKYDGLLLMSGVIVGMISVVPLLALQAEYIRYGEVMFIWSILHVIIYTFSEISIIPILLSLVPLTVPKRHRGSAMGVYYAAGAIGAELSGKFSVLSIKHSNFSISLIPVALTGAILIGVLLVFHKQLQPAFETKTDAKIEEVKETEKETNE